MRVSLIITGRAICDRDNNGNLEALFFKSDIHHKLTLEVTKIRTDSNKSITGVYILPEKAKITIGKTNVTATPAPIHPDADIENVIDMNTLQGGPIELKIFPHPGVNDPKLSYLSFDEANWYTFKTTQMDIFEHWKYDVQQHRKTRERTGKIGFELAADYDVAAGGTISVIIEEPFGMSFPFDFEEGVRYEIKFANNCPETDCEEDFHLNYDIIDGSQVKIEQFIPPNSRDKEPSCNVVRPGDPPGGGGNPGARFLEYYRSGGART